MTVADLIKQLESLPQEMEVVLEDGDTAPVCSVQKVYTGPSTVDDSLAAWRWEGDEPVEPIGPHWEDRVIINYR